MGKDFNSGASQAIDKRTLSQEEYDVRSKYYQQLSKGERALLLKIPSLKDDKYQEAVELLMGMRRLLGLIEAEKITKPFSCHACKDNAMYFNFNLNKGYCFTDWNFELMKNEELKLLKGKL